ncbi:hypothetical protein GWK26_11875 [haloarchaeon 3A1-DGR]|nr:hypothetical protein GWK26_11875 [haloarchaeon 3A1-DGR]
MADGPRLESAMSYINKAGEIGGFGANFTQGASAVVLGFFTMILGIGEAFASLITNPVDAFASTSVLLIEAIFGGPARFLQSSWNAAATSLGLSPWTSLGPFIIVVAALSVVITLWVIIWFLDAQDVDTPTGLDLPFINLDTGGDLEDEND